MKHRTCPRALALCCSLALLPAVACAQAASATDSYDGPFLTRDHLGGDWFGTRDALKAHGLDLKLEWTEFYYGLADGTPDDDITDGGRVDFFASLDGHKAGLWPGLFVNVHGEFRYGDVSTQGGALSAVNTAMISPASDGDIFAFTNVTVTQAFSERVLLTVGKFSTLDLYEKNFIGGRGVEGFMNLNFVAPPIAARTVPLSTLGAIVSVLDDKGRSLFNIGVLDARSPSTSSGFDGLAADEVTVTADYSFYTKFGGLDGTHNLSATWSSIDAFSLDGSDFIHLPAAPVAIPTRKEDSWQVTYLYEQFLCQDAADPKKGWGVFGLVGVSDGNPNPIEWNAAVGLGVKGIGDIRPNDRAGLGLFYLGLSGDVRSTLSPIVPISDEYGAELYYDCAVTRWFRLAGDVQVIRPAVSQNDTAIYAGLRGRLIF